MNGVRYRIGEDPATAASTITDEVLLFSLVLGVVIGVALTWLGLRGRQMWLVTWSVGLVLVSIGTMVWILIAGG